MQYNIFEPWKTLDPWQEKYIETEGNCFLLCGRQSGKTAAASIKFGKRAATKKNRIIMMIAETEKQAYNLFFKTLMYLSAKYPKMIKQGKDKKTGQKMSPTKHLIHLTNGSIIMCYAAGLEGSGLRTYTLTDLVIDEAAPMAREIFIATMPMLSVTGGTMDIMSTPRGAEGFFYDCSKDDDFTHFYVSAEDCSRHDKKFLEKQKKRMSELEYAQEYLAKFLSDLKRLFSDKWVKDVVTLKRRETTIKNRKYYLGSDIGGMGEDESSYEVFDKISKTNIEQVENITSSKNHIQENVVKIDRLEAEYKIWVDTKFVSNFIMGDDPLDGRDVIKMGMWEVNLDAFLLIDNRSPISCQIDIVSYISNKHSYLVEISFLLDKKHIKGYFYDEKEPTYIDNKFDVIDLE
ncbi:hypothetical protein LCGC14_1087910 [marine sediment metagenome]|uniref:Uncharacterized protein n=1 Tax=marine sediment metagenome TaxID=412755 RepID=A0A0F9N0Y6_9ZZZZ